MSNCPVRASPAPVMTLIASAAIIDPMIPGKAPITPASAQLGATPGAGSFGNTQA